MIFDARWGLNTIKKCPVKSGWLMSLALVLALALAQASAASAQQFNCTYERCALWISRGVVRGADAAPASTGSLVPRVDVLATADSATYHRYHLARRDFARSGVLAGLSMGTMVATLVYYGSGGRDWRTPAGIGLPAAMLLSLAGAALFAGRADDHMRRAIWTYNRGLSPSPGVLASSCPYDACALRRQGGWIVQGLTETRVAKVGSQESATLFAADSSARVEHEAFLAANRRGARLWRASLGAIAAGGIVLLVGRDKAAQYVGGGLLFAGYAIGHPYAVYESGEVAQHLDRAIWLYNGRLGR